MKILFLLFLGITLLTSCSSAGAEFGSMTGQEAYELYLSDSDVILLDVRSEEEFLDRHIAGSTSLPVNEIEDLITEVTEDKAAIILVICQSGNRSQVASQILVDLGFTNVYDIGGVNRWPGDLIN